MLFFAVCSVPPHDQFTMAAVQMERAATPITYAWESVLEAVRLECQMLWKSSAALCEMCLGQEGCLCQVPVALLWGSVCCCSAGSHEQSCCTNSFLLAAASAQPGRAEFQFLVCIFVRQCHTQLCVLVPIIRDPRGEILWRRSLLSIQIQI